MDFTRGSLVPPRKRKAGPGSIVIGVNQEAVIFEPEGRDSRLLRNRGAAIDSATFAARPCLPSPFA